MDEQQQWYVTVAGNAVGPVSTDLVLRGIKHNKIAPEAFVCVVGATEWQPLNEVPEFRGALAEQAQHPQTSTMLAAEQSPAADFNNTADSAHAPTDIGTQNIRITSPGIDVVLDFGSEMSGEPQVNWNQGFAEYFLVSTEVELPQDAVLLKSLRSTAPVTFLEDEPMWNLALCLAFGTDTVASAVANAFFDVVTAHDRFDRVEWMVRTLLSRGFMPSGIPHAAGNRGISRLRAHCPAALMVQLETQLGI